MFNGYLEMGGTEIVNAARTAAYVRHGIPSLELRECDGCEGLHEVLGHAPYQSPLVDQPVWFDEANVDSWDFYGLYPLGMDGFEDGVSAVTVTELMGDGAAVTPPRRASRQLRVSALLIGRTDAALAYGMTWLRNALLGNGCRDSLVCTGDHLCYFSACPPVCADSPSWPDQDGDGVSDPVDEAPWDPEGRNARHDTPVRSCEDGLLLGPLSQCTAPYERVLYDVTIMDGPRITERYPSDCAKYVKVEFTLVAATPSPVGVARWALGPGSISAPPVLVPEVACTIDGSRAERHNRFPSPSLNGDYQDYLWGLTPSLEPGVSVVTGMTPQPEIVRALRIVAQDTMPSPGLAYLYDVGRISVDTATRPRTQGSVEHTASVYVRSSRAIRANIQVSYYRANGQGLESSNIGTDDVPANDWGRVAVRFTPPAGTDYVRVRAWADVSAGGVVAGDTTWWTGALLEIGSATGTYFDGDTPDTEVFRYDWQGSAGTSISVQYAVVDTHPIVVDPDCAVIPTPPRPPLVVDSCLVYPSFWRRYQYQVDHDLIPVWSDVLPYLTIATGPSAVRQVRVRFYPNPKLVDLGELEPCDFCGEFVVSYIPPNSRLLVDGIRQEASVTTPGGLVRAASHLLYSSDGGPMEWAALTCGLAYTMTVDVAPDTITDMALTLCLAARE